MIWLVEEGIGEHRAIRLDGDIIREARIAWPGELAAGAVVDARLESRQSGASRGTARLDDGTQVLVDRIPRDAQEGASLRIAITRAAIAEPRRMKRAQGRPDDGPLRPAPDLAAILQAEGHEVRIVHRFPDCDWDDLMADATSGQIAFAGGAIDLYPTPAMTLIDIDGTLPPPQLALAAVPAIADAIRRFDIGGSIGIDFPTLEEKSARKAVDVAMGDALADWSHERTAMNGFGFVQIVSRLRGPSILHRVVTRDPAGTAARQLIRRAEGIAEPGVILMRAHPRVIAAMSEDWLAQLGRRTGRDIRVEGDPALALHAGFAQAFTP